MMATQTGTVFVVDDDPAVCKSLSRVLESVNLQAKVFNSAGDFLAHFDPAEPGCLVLDVRLPDMSGLELQKLLIQRHVSTPVIMISGHAEIPMAVQAVQAGAIDFIQKPFSYQVFIDRVQEALSHDASTRIEARKADEIAARRATLSPREVDVLERLVAGRSAKQIAAELGISSKTIDNHRARILEKMGVESTVELVRLILSQRPER